MTDHRAGHLSLRADAAEAIDHQGRATVLHSNWRTFLLIGLALVVGGVLAIALPHVSTFATSVVLGVGLAFAGIVKMIQSFRVKEWSGFIWQELTGIVELVGGILIYFNPLKGALAITAMIALVLLVQGVLQIMLAATVRNWPGWYWFAISGLIALAASASLALKLSYTYAFEPGAIAGLSLLLAGLAYVAVALTVRQARA